MSIYEKLANIQNALFVPKGQKNNFGGYNYRTCEDIMKQVKPLCAENKCVLFITNDLVDVDGRVYVKATARLVDTEDGTSVESTAHAREEETKKGMDGSQITGASSSYARKYALAGLFCIDNEKDSDATNNGQTEKAKADNTIQIKALRERMKNSGVSEEYLTTLYKVKLEDMTDKHFSNINANWEKIVEGAKK